MFRNQIEQLERRQLLTGGVVLDSIDDVFDAIRSGDVAYDLNEDGTVDATDGRFFVEQVLGTRPGDANLDGEIDFRDFLSLSQNFNAVDATYSEGDFDGNGSVGFLDFLQLSGNFGFETAGRHVAFGDGSKLVPNRTIYDALAHAEDFPGAIGIREVKFMIDVAAGEVFFVNQNRHAFHYQFALAGMDYQGTNAQFSADTYFRDSRRFLAGSVLAHDNVDIDNELGVYTIEFWPTDPVKSFHVDLAVEYVTQAMPFISDRFFYHPSSETQRDLYTQEIDAYAAAGIPVIQTEDLFGNQTFAPLNHGVGYGRLRVVNGSYGVPLSPRDVVIFENIPNDLTHVAGVISVEPQTPLSHVNLRAKQNDTPNAYIRDALLDTEVLGLIGKNVRFEVINDTYTLREATETEVEEHFDQIRPVEQQIAVRDLSRTAIVTLDNLRNADQSAYGAKAANLGELASLLPDAQVPDGFAIPFAFYDEFMETNGFYADVAEFMADPRFTSDAGVRDRVLDSFRDRIQDGEVPSHISTALDNTYNQLVSQHGASASFRARSSTNNEDLVGFTGAGLYRSYTHRPHEGKLENTIKQVWSSLWTFRAFEEREFWRIDHLSAAMGVAIHPNFDLEEVNGVAVTKNIYDENWPGFYVNAQVGEDLVTNPEDGAVPEEFLISPIGENFEWETQYIRRSNLTDNGAPVLSEQHVLELRIAMQRIQSHFRAVYNAFGDREFAMDIEFKVDTDGQLVIKQARPWVD